uniref:Uncharacterized protein n=1 Tax=Anguilla anguilla TaxID=7936 RepID=A0A0E9VFK6_ANGAN
MSTGSISDVDDFHEAELLDDILKLGSGKDSGASNESTEESSNCEGGSIREDKEGTGKKKRPRLGRTR